MTLTYATFNKRKRRCVTTVAQKELNTFVWYILLPARRMQIKVQIDKTNQDIRRNLICRQEGSCLSLTYSRKKLLSHLLLMQLDLIQISDETGQLLNCFTFVAQFRETPYLQLYHSLKIVLRVISSTINLKHTYSRYFMTYFNIIIIFITEKHYTLYTAL